MFKKKHTTRVSPHMLQLLEPDCQPAIVTGWFSTKNFLLRQTHFPLNPSIFDSQRTQKNSPNSKNSTKLDPFGPLSWRNCWWQKGFHTCSHIGITTWQKPPPPRRRGVIHWVAKSCGEIGFPKCIHQTEQKINRTAFFVGVKGANSPGKMYILKVSF